jgi:hypothetical protein
MDITFPEIGTEGHHGDKKHKTYELTIKARE